MIRIIIFSLSLIFLGCATDNIEEDTPGDQLIYPIGITLDQNEDRLFISNGNFDLRYKGASVNVIDLDSKKLRPEQTLFTNNFLSSFEYDLETGELFTISRDSGKLYIIQTTGENLECGTTQACENFLKLPYNAPFALTLDQQEKRIYIGYKDSETVSIISYKDSTLTYIDSIDLEVFSGEITAVNFNPENNLLYIGSSYAQTLTVLKPIFDANNNLVDTFYHEPIYVTNRSIGNASTTPGTQSISFINDELILTLSQPAAIATLKSGKRYAGDFTFHNNLNLPYYPVKMACTPENICVTSLYESKKVALFDLDQKQVIKIIDLDQRVYDLVYSQKRKEIYATLFAENGILVLEMDPEKVTYLSVKEILHF